VIFIFHYGYTIGTVTPFSQAFVDAVKATFQNGASDYRRDARVWLFDEADEAKVLDLVAAHFPQATVLHFVSTDQLVAV